MGKLNIFLIRHGESVDNVAGLYAGSRDSPLTAHGVLQASRLASHLATAAPPATHIFTSNLKRAVYTAGTVREAQPPPLAGMPAVDVVQLLDLREKDFGADEGKKYGQRDHVRATDAETHDAMQARASRFVDSQLAPIIAALADKPACVMIVAHGLILASLLRVLRGNAWFASSSEPTDSHASWSNTGYTQLVVEPLLRSSSQPRQGAGEPSSPPSNHGPRWPDLRLSIVVFNNTTHLVGLKKTRGGIGSAQFDQKQKTLTSFFAAAPPPKKRKAEDQLEK
ncbi:phosphatase like protein [Verticillium longisporum]|nr:phosphatase like protein [Verticillium longisporum]